MNGPLPGHFSVITGLVGYNAAETGQTDFRCDDKDGK
jgi:hypothetical protein